VTILEPDVSECGSVAQFRQRRNTVSPIQMLPMCPFSYYYFLLHVSAFWSIIREKTGTRCYLTQFVSPKGSATRACAEHSIENP